MADDVQVIFGADISRLIKATEDSKVALESITEGAKLLGEAIGLAFTIEGIASFVEKMGELGLQTERAMITLGGTAEQIGLLGGIAKLTGSSMEGISNSIEKLSLNVQKSTKDAFNPAAQGLKALGLSAKDLIGLAPDQYFEKLSEAVSKFNPSLNLTNAVMAAGGRGVAQLLPMLQLGADGFRRFKEEIDRTGAALTEAQASGFAKTHEGVTLLGMSVQGLENTLFDGLKPAVDGIVGSLRDFVQWVNDSAKAGGTLSGLMDTLSWSAKAVATAFASLLGTVRGLGEAVAAVWHLATGEVEEFEKTAEKSAKNLEKIAAETRDRISEIWTAHVDVHPQHRADAGAVDMGGEDRLAAQMKEIQGEIKLAQEALAQKKVLLDGDLAQFRVTQDQKFALLESATQKEYQVELGLLQKELALGGLKLAQRAEINAKIKELETKHATEMIKLDEQSIAAMTAKWQQALGAIETAFNSQLRGLLAGTTTWAAAFKNILGDLLIKFIEVVEKLGIEWAATQLGMTTATTTGAAARATAEVAGQEASLPARILKFESDLLAAASIGAANAYAALAAFPPAAAAAAAAAFSGIEALGQSGVPKLDTGGYVVRSGLAVIHQGEVVNTAAEVARGTGPHGGGVGGGTLHVEFNHQGNLTVQQVKEHAYTLARHMRDLLNQNPGLRPSY
jgi:hypothetical protein